MAARKSEKDDGMLLSPVALFDKYLELIFAKDVLWYRFLSYLRSLLPFCGDDSIYRRDPENIEIWRGMLDNMGGGLPLSLYAAASFELLAYEKAGHDLDKELRYAKARITRQRNRKLTEDYEYAKQKYC